MIYIGIDSSTFLFRHPCFFPQVSALAASLPAFDKLYDLKLAPHSWRSFTSKFMAESLSTSALEASLNEPHWFDDSEAIFGSQGPVPQVGIQVKICE